MKHRGKWRDACEWVYLTAAGFFLMWNLFYMTEAEWTFAAREWFPAVWYVLAAASLLMSRFRVGAVQLLGVLLAWMAGTSLWRGAEVLSAVRPALNNGVLAFLVIAPIPFMIERRRLKRWLQAVLICWTLGMTLLAATGLWAALTGHAVFSLRGTWYIGVNLGDHRLYMMAYVTTAAVKQGMSALMALMLAVMTKRLPGRLLWGLCAVVQLACLALTDCRTAFIALGAALGMMAATWMLRSMHKGMAPWRRLLQAAGAGMAALALTAGTYLALSGSLMIMAPHVPQELHNITLRELPTELLPEAAAEETIRHRGLEEDNLFNNRQAIWQGALNLMRSRPQVLFTGTTSARSAELTNAFIPAEAQTGLTYKHVHNLFLQALVNWGIPGAALLAAFTVLLLIAAARVLVRKETPGWLRFAPAIAAYMLLCDLIDCHMLLAEGTPMLLYASLFAALTLANGGAGEAVPLARPGADVV